MGAELACCRVLFAFCCFGGLIGSLLGKLPASSNTPELKAGADVQFGFILEIEMGLRWAWGWLRVGFGLFGDFRKGSRAIVGLV